MGVSAAIIMTEAEAAVLRMLTEQKPSLVPAYLEQIPHARQETLRKLLASFFREDMLQWRTGGRALRQEEWPDVCMRWIQPGECVWRAEEQVLLHIRHVYGFERADIAGAICIEQGQAVRIEAISDLFRRLPHTEAFASLQEEIENSSANLALAYAYGTPQTDVNAPLFYEQLCVVGHNLHPCAKTKLGMQPEDVLRYAPEFRQEVPLRVAAVHKEYMEQSGLAEKPLLPQLYPELLPVLEAALQQKGLSAAEYTAVPVHPWQWEHIIPSVYNEELQKNIIVLLPSFSVSGFASSSFRTVETGRLAIKTAVHSQMTSTVRSISPQTANNAAVFTKMLQQVMAQEPGLQELFRPLYELEGGSFRSQDGLKQRNLSYVLRQTTAAAVHDGETAIVGAALYNQQGAGEYVICRIVQQYAKHAGRSMEQAGQEWFRQYAKLLLTGTVTLMVKYGIGLEGHMQNIIPVFRQGWPVRLLFRDWGGARLYAPRLQQAGLQPQFYPESLIVTDDIQEMHNKVLYTVVQNHLGEVIYLLCRYAGLQERALWGEVSRQCRQLFVQLQPEYATAVQEDLEAFFAEETDYKALLTMRLQGGKGYQYVKVPNPLSAFKR